MIRPRRPADLPDLARVLRAQQPRSRYPLRDPLPIPVEEFLHAHDAEAAWTAEVDGEIVGHVCRVGALDDDDAVAANALAAAAHGRPVGDLSWVSALFVAEVTRGTGLGRRLLDTVVADIAAAGRAACLEVLPVHAAAAALYASTGWTEAGRVRPAWLRSEVGDAGPDVRVLVRP